MVDLLDNGLTVLTERRRGLAFALDLSLPRGAAHDPPGREGTAALLEEWLWRGAGDLSARGLANAFDDSGLRRGGGVTHERTRLGVSGRTADFGRALDLTAQVLRRPHLNETDFAALADLARQDLEGLADDPAEQLGVQLRARAFGAPYAHPVSGTLQALGTLTAGDVRRSHARLGPAGAVLVVVGDLPEDEALKMLGNALGAWPGGPSKRPEVKFRPDLYAHVPDDSQQTQLGALFAGVDPDAPEWPLFQLALGVLSGGGASRLFQEVREARGLAYSVGAGAQVTGGRGFAWASAGSTPARAQETLDVLLSEFARLARGVSEAEFKRARAQLLSAVVFGSESAGGRAAALSRDWLTLGRVRPRTEVRETLLALRAGGLNAFLEAHPFRAPTVVTLGPAPLQAGGERAVA